MASRTLLVAALFIALPAQADFLGAVDGRAADLDASAEMSVEVNYSSMDISGVKSTWSGVRGNYKYNENIIVFADAIQLKLKSVPIVSNLELDHEGTGFGGGVIYQVPDLLDGYNTSFKGTYHTIKTADTVDLNINGNARESQIEMTSMAAKLLVSPLEKMSNGGTWYASAGYSSGTTNVLLLVDGKDDSSGFTAGAGFVMPLSFGEVYGGAEYIEGNSQFGAGFRYSFE